ncbi:uncharacterized protein SOCE26_054540 [Sorangium cellulosum]|uniref:Rhs family protein n=1 Tax=Sorangium cellulosum TaxID=56 RepID=A0A2L0EXG8_SORCE|nr:hypothetical protein [Sorangium cellulosum]AUX43997.1 uncharacterized protein SOCE26_054540 [Sorangium cellulosum]
MLPDDAVEGNHEGPKPVLAQGGMQTELGYDLRGRRTSVSDPDAGTRITQYNGYGEIREEVDAQGRTAVVERDAMGRTRGTRTARC